MGFRLKRGPLTDAINSFIVNETRRIGIAHYDLVWVDKAVFITEKTTRTLRNITSRLIHYTPDMAFYANRSSHFYHSIIHYNFVVTTKSAEISQYASLVPHEKLIITTQGYDKHLHRPLHTFEEKEHHVSFVGLCEPHREKVIQLLINHRIPVKLAGKGWVSFVKKNRNNTYLSYLGESVYGDEYVRLISSSVMSLGLLSKKFPELHTTRTFEIPACGTLLVTEKNKETTSFFTPHEALFYEQEAELPGLISKLLSNPVQLKEMTLAGREKVIKSGRDYETLLKSVLIQTGIL
jgi:spore maturation protein CgeB